MCCLYQLVAYPFFASAHIWYQKKCFEELVHRGSGFDGTDSELVIGDQNFTVGAEVVFLQK